MTRLHFDATTVAPSVPMELIPAGKYLAAITKSGEKATKSGNGSYLELEFTILEGDYRNRKVWDIFNLKNPSSDAVEIAEANLSAICHAVGVMSVEFSTDLHNLPLIINVTTKKDDYDGLVRNKVKGYAKYESRMSAKSTPQVAVPAVLATNNESPPWGENVNSDTEIPF